MSPKIGPPENSNSRRSKVGAQCMEGNRVSGHFRKPIKFFADTDDRAHVLRSNSAPAKKDIPSTNLSFTKISFSN